jgi:hypothetical protein
MKETVEMWGLFEVRIDDMDSIFLKIKLQSVKMQSV